MVTDQDRHRQSVLVWLRQRGYHSLAQVQSNPEARYVVAGANIREADLMEPVVLHGDRRDLRLEWLEPGEDPPRSPRSSVYDQAREILASRPGVWCHLEGAGPGTVSALRKRGIAVSERQNGSAKPEVYARWTRPE